MPAGRKYLRCRVCRPRRAVSHPAWRFGGVLEFVPLVLAVSAAVIAALHAPILAFWVCGFLATLRVVEDYVIYPRLIRHGVHLHPLAVVVAVLAGVELRGIAGIFVAVPVVALISVAARHWLEWRDTDGIAGDGHGRIGR